MLLDLFFVFFVVVCCWIYMFGCVFQTDNCLQFKSFHRLLSTDRICEQLCDHHPYPNTNVVLKWACVHITVHHIPDYQHIPTAIMGVLFYLFVAVKFSARKNNYVGELRPPPTKSGNSKYTRVFILIIQQVMVHLVGFLKLNIII